MPPHDTALTNLTCTLPPRLQTRPPGGSDPAGDPLRLDRARGALRRSGADGGCGDRAGV